MRSLFFTIFRWLWFTVILVGVIFIGSIGYSVEKASHDERARVTLASTLLAEEANKAAAVFEGMGAAGLRQYLENLEQRNPVQAFFFSEGRLEIPDRTPPPGTGRIADIMKMASLTDRNNGLQLDGALAGQRATSPGGKHYSLILLLEPRDTGLNKSGPGLRKSFVLLELPIIALLAGGVFSFLITRHITSPLLRLRAAAASIAQGHLDTRVSPALGKRRDEIAQLAQDFDRMAERIESLLTGHKRLLGDVSHELRSPLSRLIVALGLVKQGPKEDVDEHLDRIALEAHRLDTLIGQLLTLSRIDSGAHTATATSFDLTNLIHEIAGDADFEARSRSRRVVVTTADQCNLNGTEEVLRSAIENIVRNAIRFTPDGTAVEVSLQVADRKAELLVRDHGPGVPEEMLSEIFLPFRRVPIATEPASDGAGLGLAIAQRAIAMHNGTIRATNAPDGGLIIEVELPLGSVSV